MPTRLHKPLHEPPGVIDRWLSHPWQVHVVAGVWSALGLVLCWTWIDPGGGPGTVLQTLPAYLAGGVSVALLLSGLLILAAVAWPGADSTAWRIELVALPLGAAAWASYGVVATSWGWQVIAVGYVTGALVRIVAVWLVIRRGRAVVIVER